MAIAIAHNRGGIPPRADMFSSALPSNDASHAILLAGLCLAALAVAGVLYRRMACLLYTSVEHRLLAAIYLRFGLPAKIPDTLQNLIKAADRAAAYLEATRLAGFEDAEARKFFGQPPKFSAAIERDYLTPWTASVAEQRFRQQMEKLLRA